MGGTVNEKQGERVRQSLQDLMEEASRLFENSFHESPELTAFAPGRINIIGEHTDYNGGLSMPCAIDRWVIVSLKAIEGNTIRILSEDFNEWYEGDWPHLPAPQNTWQQYVYGCLQIFFEQVAFRSGFLAVIHGNVPIGSGVSSSAALEVAWMNALNGWYSKPLHPLELIQKCQRVEHEYLKVKSGLLDQYASQFSKSGYYLVLDFEQLSHRYIPASLGDYVWVLCDSGIKRSLAGSKYSERVEETKEGLKAIQALVPSLHSFRDLEETHLELLKNTVWRKRLRHYITENRRVIQCEEALANGNAAALGILITASHLSLRDDYEVSCDEMDFLVEQAITLPYCLGSRMMGGGFGGCTLNLVQKDHVEDFLHYMSELFQQRFQQTLKISQYQTVDGAGFLIH